MAVLWFIVFLSIVALQNCSDQLSHSRTGEVCVVRGTCMHDLHDSPFPTSSSTPFASPPLHSFPLPLTDDPYVAAKDGREVSSFS